jgi:hypothetical protein
MPRKDLGKGFSRGLNPQRTQVLEELCRASNPVLWFASQAGEDHRAQAWLEGFKSLEAPALLEFEFFEQDQVGGLVRA